MPKHDRDLGGRSSPCRVQSPSSRPTNCDLILPSNSTRLCSLAASASAHASVLFVKAVKPNFFKVAAGHYGHPGTTDWYVPGEGPRPKKSGYVTDMALFDTFTQTSLCLPMARSRLTSIDLTTLPLAILASTSPKSRVAGSAVPPG